MVKTFHTCSHPFTPVHTCSHLTDYLRSSRHGSFSLNFSLAKAVILRSYVLSFWNCIFFAHLIESYTTMHGLSSCVEKKCIDPSGSPYYSDHVCLSHVIFLHFRMPLFFSITSYPPEIAHFNSPNGELSNVARLMKLYWSKIVDPSRSPCLKIVNWKRFECRNFSVLRPVLLKIAYFSSANRELSNWVRLVELR